MNSSNGRLPCPGGTPKVVNNSWIRHKRQRVSQLSAQWADHQSRWPFHQLSRAPRV